MKVTTRKNASQINLTKMQFTLMKCKNLYCNDRWLEVWIIDLNE
jgi:hypothetical protein